MANIISFRQLPTEIQNYVHSEYELYEDDDYGEDFEDYLDSVNYYDIDDKYYQEYHDEYSAWVWVDSHFEEIDWNDWNNSIKDQS